MAKKTKKKVTKKKATKKARKKTVTKKAADAQKEGVKVNKELPVPLSATDKDELLKKYSELSLRRLDLKVEKTTKNKELQDKINGIEQDLEDMSRDIADGVRMKNVQATMVKDFDREVIEYWYDDQVLETKKMTESDKQEQFDMEKAALEKEARKKRQKKSDTIKQKVKKGEAIDLDEALADDEDDVGNVHKLETSKKTKKSSVDPAGTTTI